MEQQERQNFLPRCQQPSLDRVAQVMFDSPRKDPEVAESRSRKQNSKSSNTLKYESETFQGWEIAAFAQGGFVWLSELILPQGCRCWEDCERAWNSVCACVCGGGGLFQQTSLKHG